MTKAHIARAQLIIKAHIARAQYMINCYALILQKLNQRLAGFIAYTELDKLFRRHYDTFFDVMTYF